MRALRFAPFLLLICLAVGVVTHAQAAGSGSSFAATEDQPYSGPVATWTEEREVQDARIEWGDGQQSSGTLVQSNPSESAPPNWTVNGSHTYSEPGSYTVKVTAKVNGQDETVNATATVSEAGSGQISLAAQSAKFTQGEQPQEQTLATFTDQTPGAADSYIAQVSWGDGESSKAQVTETAGGFAVRGAHPYARPGNYIAQIKLTAEDGRGANASAPVTVSPSPALTKLAPPKVGQLLAPARPRADKKIQLRLNASARKPTAAQAPGAPAGASNKVVLQLWKFGDKRKLDHQLDNGLRIKSGQPVEGVKPVSHLYDQPGVKVVEVKSFDAHGNLTQTAATLPVAGKSGCGDPIPPAAQINASFVAYEPKVTVSFDGTQGSLGYDGCDDPPSSDKRKYVWEFGDGLKSAKGQVEHTYAQFDKTYTVKLTVKSNLGKSSVTMHVHTPKAYCGGDEPLKVKSITVTGTFYSCLIPVDLDGGGVAYLTQPHRSLDINGIFLRRADSQDRILVDPDSGGILSWPLGSDASLYARRSADLAAKKDIGQVAGGFILPEPNANDTALVEFDPNPDYELEGFKLAGPVGLAFHSQKLAEIVARFAPPPPLQGGEFPVPLDAPAGQPIEIKPPDMYFGPVRAHSLAFTRYPNGSMTGSGGLIILDTADLSAEFAFGPGGVFESAAAGYSPNPPIPIFPLFTLNEIGAGIFVNPFSIQGNAKIVSTLAIGDLSLFSINGCFNLATANPGQVVKRWCDEHGFPTGSFTEPSGLARLHLTGSFWAFGDAVELAQAYLDASTEGLHVHGSAKASVEWPEDFEIASASAVIDGQANAQGSIQVFGGGTVCAFEVCRKGEVLASNLGGAACLGMEFDTYFFGSYTVNMGGWVRWDFSDGGLAFAGCDVGDKDHVAVFSQLPSASQMLTGQASAMPQAQASLKLSKQAPVHIIAASGQNDDPSLVVSAPNGRKLVDPGKTVIDEKKGLAWLHDSKTRQTFLVLANAKLGSYSVSSADGQPLTQLSSARGLPEPKLKGEVTGSGEQRQLVFSGKLPDKHKLVFFESSASGARQIGSSSQDAGKIKFEPASGRADKRKVYGYVLRNGIPRRRILLDTYQAPKPRPLAAPDKLQLSGKGRTLLAEWKPVAGAQAYEVNLRLSDGRERVIRTKKTSFSFADALDGSSATISVRSLGGRGERGLAVSDKTKLKRQPLKVTL